jgi:uncharacterized damage-inducible protein DinB
LVLLSLNLCLPSGGGFHAGMVVISHSKTACFAALALIWHRCNPLIYIVDSPKGELSVPELAPVVSSELASYYEGVRDNVHKLLAPFSTEQLWKKPYPYGNSIGHLLLHLTGNLSHYIGATIANTGYVRNRPLEFSDASKRSKEQVLADFDAAISMVVSTIRKQSAQDLVAPYSDPTDPGTHTRFGAFLRMAAHAYHHVGQIIYLAKELTRPHS